MNQVHTREPGTHREQGKSDATQRDNATKGKGKMRQNIHTQDNVGTDHRWNVEQNQKTEQ